MRAKVGGTPSRSTVRVSASPSRRLAATREWVLSNSWASAWEQRLRLREQGTVGVVGGAHLPADLPRRLDLWGKIK